MNETFLERNLIVEKNERASGQRKEESGLVKPKGTHMTRR